MPIKTKKSKSSVGQLAILGKQAGILLMTAAATLGMLELPDHSNSRIIVPNQPVFAFAGQNENIKNPLQRERQEEEASPQFISYTVMQRTPGRTGRA
jgi:hypothetical protein